MTLEEMTQVTLNHWYTNYPKDFRKLGKEEALKQAQACARLTRREMDALKLISPSMTDGEAWAESRNLFCLTPPPKIETDEDDDW